MNRDNPGRPFCGGALFFCSWQYGAWFRTAPGAPQGGPFNIRQRVTGRPRYVLRGKISRLLLYGANRVTAKQLGKFPFGPGADQPLYNITILEQHEGRNGANRKPVRDVG
jgi:hypothetical protein